MPQFINRHYKLIVVLLLLTMLTVEVTSGLKESQIIDEAPHIAAGYSYLKTWNFKLNPEHPPLIKMLSGFPLLFIKQQPLSENPGWQSGEQWYAGQYLLYRNSVEPTTLLFWGRLPIMLISILLGLIIFKWAKDLFGITGGLLALLFYTFDPTTLAHSRWITTDLGIAFFMFATLFFLARFFKKPVFGRALVFALFFGLALVAKFSAVILIPLVLLYIIIAKWQGWPRNSLNPDEVIKAFSIKKLILLTLVVGFIVVWATYGFELKKPFDDPEVSVAFAPGKSEQQFDKAWLKFINNILDTNNSIGRFTQNLAQIIPVPAYTYAKGFAVLANHNYWGHSSYLLGQHSKVGWWYYFAIAFLVKTPTITLLALLGLIGLLIYHLSKKGFQAESNQSNRWLMKLKKTRLDWYLIILTPALYFIWTLTSKLNLGVRHLLPVYAFLFVLIGYYATIRLVRFRKLISWIAAGLIIFYLVSSISIYPHYLSYFNEVVDGPTQGHKYLLDSNIDWGQDLIFLKKYMDDHQLDKIYFHYFGTAYPEAYGIIYESPPTNDQLTPDFHGTVAISVSGLFSENQEYSWLLKYKPVDRVGYSIWIYNIE